MPISPMDEYLAHQTTETFDHVFTSDKNFYDRYYFNMHASSGELFMVAGMGQYPNLGVTDAFVAISHGTNQYVVRASRSSVIDRLDTQVGPFSDRSDRGTEIPATPMRRERMGALLRSSSSKGRFPPSKNRRLSAESCAHTARTSHAMRRSATYTGTLTVAGRPTTSSPETGGARAIDPGESGRSVRPRRRESRRGLVAEKVRLLSQLDSASARSRDVQGHVRRRLCRRDPWSTKAPSCLPSGSRARSSITGRHRSRSTSSPGTREIKEARTLVPNPNGEDIRIRSRSTADGLSGGGDGLHPPRRLGAWFLPGAERRAGRDLRLSTQEKRSEYAS